MRIEQQVRSLDTLASQLANATSVKEKVRLADRIFETLAECEGIVENFIVGSMAKSTTANGTSPKSTQIITDTVQGVPPHGQSGQITESQHEGMPLAEIVTILLTPNVVMHGSEIEAAAKLAGFKSESEKFQSYLAVALKRAGGFENLGRNRWKLNPAILPEKRPAKKNP